MKKLHVGIKIFKFHKLIYGRIYYILFTQNYFGKKKTTEERPMIQLLKLFQTYIVTKNPGK
jgi:hypothetical protein